MADNHPQLKPSPCVEELKLPKHVQELRTQYLRVKAVVSAERMWDRMLTPEDRIRLGGDFEQAFSQQHGTLGMWMKLRGVSAERALIDVAYGTGFLTESTRDWLLREVGEHFASGERTLDQAMFDSKLVIIEKPRQAFWNGEPIEIDWDKESAPWSFFWELCRGSRRSCPVTREDLGERMSPTAFSTRKGRLVNHESFPKTLEGLVESKPGGYQLDLSPQDIRVFLAEQEDRITEWTG
jgi:hypothetical protein